MHGDSRLIHLWPRAEIIDHTRQHTIGGGAGFDRRLPGSRAIHSDVANAVGQDRGKALSQIFLSAVESIHCDNHWHRTCGPFGKAEVAYDLLTFERNVNHLKGWIH